MKEQQVFHNSVSEHDLLINSHSKTASDVSKQSLFRSKGSVSCVIQFIKKWKKIKALRLSFRPLFSGSTITCTTFSSKFFPFASVCSS